MFSLNNFLDFNPIKIYYDKSRVLSCTNRTILDITFKFMTRHSMRLIFDCFYAPRKKRRLSKYLELMYGQSLPVTVYIECLYIDFLFSFIFFLFFEILVFLFFYFFFFYYFVIISWNLVIFYCYVLIMWEVWGFLFPSIRLNQRGTLPGIADNKFYRLKYQDSSTIDATVKEDNSPQLTRSQDPDSLQITPSMAGYD
jgi:hypothetical protein